MNETIREHFWIPLILVACASFIIALDTTFMNVSISQVVADLNTDVSTNQMTMAFYLNNARMPRLLEVGDGLYSWVYYYIY